MESSGTKITRTSPVLTQTILFGLIVFVICCMYLVMSMQDFTPRIVNKAVGGTAVILIGLSFIVSSMNYFWHVGAEQVMYRRNLGLLGASFAIVHAILSLFIITEISPAFNPNQSVPHFISFILGTFALAIYIDMMIVSNVFSIKLLGGKLWKRILHAGYIAYILTVLHFALRGYQSWADWYMNANNPFIPFSLLLFLFGVIVICMRISMLFSMKKTNSTTSSSQTAS